MCNCDKECGCCKPCNNPCNCECVGCICDSRQLFHRSFMDILQGKDPLETIYNNLKRMSPEMLNLDYNILPKTPETVIRIAPLLLSKIKRPQILIDSTPDYYVAKDTQTNTIYMCYRDVLMIDIDLKHNPNVTQSDITQHFSNIQGYCFKVYKSERGYHVFCLNKRFEYRDIETVKFMIDNQSDFYYCVYSYIRGFSVRLNPKFKDQVGKCIYTLVDTVGDVNLIDEFISKLVDKHVEYAKKYTEELNMN